MQSCVRTGLLHVTHNLIHLADGSDVWGRAVWEHFAVVKTPGHLGRAYRDMLARTDLAHAPDLYVVRSAHGHGGLFVPGMIIVGQEDAERIAAALWFREGPRLRAHIRSHLQTRAATTTDPFAFLEMAVMGRILAHELGHALTYAGYQTPFAHPEAAADYLAGRLDAARGRADAVGVAIFSAIGCRELVCTHPSPAGRAHAYMSGYRHQQVVAA